MKLGTTVHDLIESVHLNAKNHLLYLFFFLLNKILIMFTKCSAEACSPSSCSLILLKITAVIHAQEQQWLWMSEGCRTWLNISNLLENLILVVF